jgi:hypothetical protein
VSWIVSNIKWIMLVAGVLTCTMFYAAVAPQAAMRTTFGEALRGPLAEIIVRSWGALVGLVGAMLIYGAYDPPARPLILIVASLGKLFFIGLVLVLGPPYLVHRASLTLTIDTMMVLLFSAYLVRARHRVRR